MACGQLAYRANAARIRPKKPAEETVIEEAALGLSLVSESSSLVVEAVLVAVPEAVPEAVPVALTVAVSLSLSSESVSWIVSLERIWEDLKTGYLLVAEGVASEASVGVGSESSESSEPPEPEVGMK